MSLVISNIVNVKNLKELETKVGKILKSKTEKNIKSSITKKINRRIGSDRTDSIIDKLVNKGKKALESSKGNVNSEMKDSINNVVAKVVGKDKADKLSKAINKGVDKIVNRVYKENSIVLSNKATDIKETLHKYGLNKEELKKIISNCLSKSPEAPKLVYIEKYSKLKTMKIKDKATDCKLGSIKKNSDKEKVFNKITDKLKYGSIKSKDLLTTRSSNDGCDWNVKLPDLSGLMGDIKLDVDMKNFLSDFSISDGSSQLLGGLKDALNNIGSKLSNFNIPGVNMPGLDVGDILNIDLPSINIPNLFKDVDVDLPDFLDKTGVDIDELFSKVKFDLGDLFKGVDNESSDTFRGFNVNMKDFLNAAGIDIRDLFKDIDLDLPQLFRNLDLDVDDLKKNKKIDFSELFRGMKINLPDLLKGKIVNIGDLLDKLNFTLPDDKKDLRNKNIEISKLLNNIKIDFPNLFKGVKVGIREIFKGLDIDFSKIFGDMDLDLGGLSLPNIDLPDIEPGEITGLFKTVGSSLKSMVNCKKIEPVVASKIINDDSHASIILKNKLKEVSVMANNSVFKSDTKTIKKANIGTIKKAYKTVKKLTTNPLNDKGVVELANELSKNKIESINSINELDKTNISSYDEITLLNSISKDYIHNKSNMINKNKDTIKSMNILA